MKVFILEDDINRIEKFRQKLRQHSVTYCDDVPTAKALLKKDKYEIIFFDHDLGGEQMVPSEHPNTGYQLAKWLREQDMHFEQIIIHTCNPGGGDRILDEVKNLSQNITRMPFPYLIHAMESN